MNDSKHQIRKVALLVESSREYGRCLLRGIIKYSKTHGPWVFYRQPIEITNPLKRLINWKPDGIIATQSGSPDMKKLHALGIPIVYDGSIKSEKKHTIYLCSNNKQIAETAAEYFLNRGFQNFAYCGFRATKKHSYEWARQRERYFCEYLQKKRYNCSVFRYSHFARGGFDNEQRKLSQWLLELPKPLALLACNDDRAQFVFEGCEMACLRVPEDVAILGIDNDPIVCELTAPPLSSIELNIESSGFQAAQALDILMQGKKPHTKHIQAGPLRVVTRHSTDILAIENKLVSEALIYIYENCESAFTVSRIAEEVGCSRRHLERCFKETLGHNVYEEIRQKRIEKIADLLLQTDMTISQVARRLHFPTASHMNRFFKRTQKVSCSKFRKKKT